MLVVVLSRTGTLWLCTNSREAWPTTSGASGRADIHTAEGVERRFAAFCARRGEPER
jgi:hypothetical protein